MVSMLDCGSRWVAASVIVFLTVGCSQNTGKPETKLADGGPESKSSAPVNSSRTDTKTPSPSTGQDDKPIAAADFPRPENAEEPMHNADTSTILFHQQGTVADQVEFYTDQLGKLGWKKQASSEVADDMAFLDFTKGPLSITVTINPLRDGKITTIAQGNGLSVPADEDDGDME